MQSARVGKRGAIIVPAKLRKRFGIEEGSIVIAEEKDDGILIRPAMVVPVEQYTPERKAEFLLSNAVDGDDYRKARKDVRKTGSRSGFDSPPATRAKWIGCSSTPTCCSPPRTRRIRDSSNSGNSKMLPYAVLAMR